MTTKFTKIAEVISLRRNDRNALVKVLAVYGSSNRETGNLRTGACDQTHTAKGASDNPTVQRRASRRVPRITWLSSPLTIQPCSSWLDRKYNLFGEVHPARSTEGFSRLVFGSRPTESSGIMRERPVPTFRCQCP